MSAWMFFKSLFGRRRRGPPRCTSHVRLTTSKGLLHLVCRTPARQRSELRRQDLHQPMCSRELTKAWRPNAENLYVPSTMSELELANAMHQSVTSPLAGKGKARKVLSGKCVAGVMTAADSALRPGLSKCCFRGTTIALQAVRNSVQ